MGLTRKTSPRVWRTMGDSEFQGNPEIWRQFNGTTFCRSGAEKLDADDNKEDDHPTFCQKWPYNSFMEDKVFISSLAADATAWLGTLNDIVITIGGKLFYLTYHCLYWEIFKALY